MVESTTLTVILLMTLQGMMVPEAVVFDPKTGSSYVSNIVGEGWEADESGFISRLKPDGRVDVLQWRTETADAKLSAPKGMCIVNGFLYCADINMIHKFALEGDAASSFIVPDAARLNDLTTDGTTLFASDTERGVVIKVNPETGEKLGEIPGVPVINGIRFHEGKLFAVSWSEHEVYELDLAGEKEPAAFGVAENFKALDGIEPLAGGFIVSDFEGNKVSFVSADGKTVSDLIDVKTPADFAIDRETGRLFVPQFKGEAVSIYVVR